MTRNILAKHGKYATRIKIKYLSKLLKNICRTAGPI